MSPRRSEPRVGWPAGWGELSQDALDAMTGLARSCATITQWLEFALALESDEPLRAVVRREAAAEPCALVLGEGGPFLRLVNGKLEGAGSLRGEPSPLPRTFDVATRLAEDPVFAAFVESRVKASRARREAERLVRAVQLEAERLSVEDFSALQRWAPLLAADAYLHTALTQMLVDHTRPLLRSKPGDGIFRWHWTQIHALSHSTLLATSAEPTAWLVAMARSFEWETWTPSFPLVRERVLRLTLRGAWAAARFGPPVVESYLRLITEAPHLLRTFDAVLGAVAIALASQAERHVIWRGIERALGMRIARATSENEDRVLQACARSVRVALDMPERARQMMLTRGLREALARGVRNAALARDQALFLALDDEIDGAEIDADGYMPAIVALPSVVSAPASVFFAGPGTTGRPGGERDAARWKAMAERTLGLALCSCGSGRAARDCCAN